MVGSIKLGIRNKLPRGVAALGAAFALVMTGCALQPDYAAPQLAVATGWQAARPHDASTAELVGWWQRFDDPVISELVHMAEAESPTLQQAAAVIDSARATLASSSGAALPQLTGSASLLRESQSATGGSVSTVRSGSLDASWEIDLFGKLRSNRESARAQLQASIDDWHDARISLAAEVADDYVQYRACRVLRDAYERQATSQDQTARSTLAAVTTGFTAPSDGYLAEASAASAASSATAQNVSCELLVKSIVELTGTDEHAIRNLIDQTSAPALPEPANFVVDSLPADLLRQRPDLAAAERTLASTYAQIGTARAERLPSLSLGGNISLSSLVSPATSGSFGPTLSLPIFDGGQRKAAVDTAKAAYQQQLGVYRSAVRSAVREVEQALVELDGAAQRSDDATRAAEQYRRYADAIAVSSRVGLSSLITLEEARRSAISAEVTLIELRRDRVRDWIALYKAVGGGWRADDLSAQTIAAASPSSEGNLP